MQLEVTIAQQDVHVTAASVRQHTILTDKPAESGGSDAGPRARELFLMSIGSCFMKNLQAAIRSRGLDIDDIQLQIIGHQIEHPKRIERIELNVSANYQDQAVMMRLVTLAERSCTLTNTLRHAVDITVSVTRNVTQGANGA